MHDTTWDRHSKDLEVPVVDVVGQAVFLCEQFFLRIMLANNKDHSCPEQPQSFSV